MIKLVVDTSSEYSLSQAQEKNISLVPVSINIDNKNYLDVYDIAKDDFYKLLISTNEFPKTSQPSPEDFINIFEEAKQNNDDVICILLSSELSGTYQSANLAKNIVEYDNIHIIDSLCVTYMIKLITDYAYNLITQGLDANAIVKKINEVKSRATVCAALDTLEYLYKGGRLNKAAATIGELANLKPVIDIVEGKVVITKKCIGKNKAMSYILQTLETIEPDTNFPIYSIYTCETDNCEKLETKLHSKEYNFISKQQIGPTIGAHVGPGAFGVVYIKK